jgi:hypothetical protein
MLFYKKLLFMTFGTTLVYWNILTMHGHINVKSPNNTSKWQMESNSAFKGLISTFVKFLANAKLFKSIYLSCLIITATIYLFVYVFRKVIQYKYKLLSKNICQ